MIPYDVVVVGAGISGLSSAFVLKQKGRTVLVLEKESRVGGSILTERGDGWLIELGPNTVLANSLAVDRLINDAGLGARRLEARKINKKRYILKEGRLVPLPGTPPAFIATPLFSLRTKLGLLKEPFIGRARDEETIGDFVRRRLGREMLDWAVGPFVSGVYAGDPERLSVRWAVRKIYALERDYGSLILGAIRKGKGPQPKGGLLSFPDGLCELPDKLAAHIGMVTTGAAVQSIEKADDGFRVAFAQNGERKTACARHCIVTGNAKEAARFLAPLDADGAIRSLPYAPVAIVALGFPRLRVGHPLDGFGFLIPQFERTPMLGCLFTSSLFPGRTPEGKVLLTAFLGGARHPEILEMTERALLDTAVEFLRPLLGIEGDPEMTRLLTWPEAIPQYNLGHERFVDWAKVLEAKHPGLHISGNLLHGVSVADCMTNACALADRIA